MPTGCCGNGAGDRGRSSTRRGTLSAIADSGLRSVYRWFFGEGAVELRRRDGYLCMARTTPRGPRVEVASAFAECDFARAVEIFASRPDEAEAELERPLDVWHSVGATTYLREGEALLAAGS